MSNFPLGSLKRRRSTSPDIYNNGAKGPQKPMKLPKRRQRFVRLLKKRKLTMAAESRWTLGLFGASVSMAGSFPPPSLKTLEELQGRSFYHPRTNLKCSSFQTITAVTSP